jgi:DNA helicase-2/ATP-dependent DNA helicase PcrA
MLNDDQKKCVAFRQGLALVVATAGSGKTRVIIERCHNLINEGISPYDILCITFSNKAADEISKRLGDVQVWVGTFHSISFKLLMMYGVLHKDTIVLDEYDKKDVFMHLNIAESLDIINKHETKMQGKIYDPIAALNYVKYQEYCKANNLVDFNEIINTMLKSLKENMDFRTSIQNKFTYIMVDEFQDTDERQYNIIKLIENNNVMCIGDDDQLIYPWRGAEIRNILNFKNVWPQSEIFFLQRNYRSTKSIVQASLCVAEKISKRLAKSTWSTNEGCKVEIYSTENEGRLIANKIKGIPNNKSVAILLRSVRQLSEIENALITHDVPYQVLMGTKFLEKAEIKAILAYLKCIFLNDLVSLKRMLTNPRRGIGDKKIKIIEETIKNGKTLIDGLNEIRAIGLAEQIKSWQLESNSEKIIKRIWEESGLQQAYEKDIDMLINKASKFPNIVDFLRNIIHLDSEESGSQTIVTTIHSAKGLEFDYVFIPGVCEGNIPHINAIRYNVNENAIDDERRVLYVGMTRPKERLFITYNPNEKHGEYFGISRFLITLPRTYVDFFKE